MASNTELIKIIKDVATAQNYEITGSDKEFDVCIERWNAVSFLIRENGSGYLEVHQWEPIPGIKSHGQYGRAVYSLRSVSDVIQFCSIMISSSAIRAKRKE
ncbi:hypothetical protein RHO14_03480 [Orbus wheelerorum]|uniref:hypothetical protein n=1 Tax=Orbus wheelerorum TaxID=3074111 RepID=UPI00370DCB83